MFFLYGSCYKSLCNLNMNLVYILVNNNIVIKLNVDNKGI